MEIAIGGSPDAQRGTRSACCRAHPDHQTITRHEDMQLAQMSQWECSHMSAFKILKTLLSVLSVFFLSHHMPAPAIAADRPGMSLLFSVSDPR